VNRPKDILRLMRPYHWVKNIFVFTGFVFGSDYNDFELFFSICMAAFAFCLVSSGVYILNDFVDIEKDKLHREKRNRPLASGKVTKRAASIVLILLEIIGIVIGYSVSVWVGTILFLYILMNICYSYKLKNIVIIDVFCISLGFMMRILVGTVGVGITPSKWLLFCGMMLTLFLGFAKRRAELKSLSQVSAEQRKVLNSYGSVFLDEIITICAGGSILSYGLYTMSEQTIKFHNTEQLMYTVPFVVFAIFRYMFLLKQRNFGEDPSKELIKDPHIVISVLGWSLSTVYILCFSSQ
jgi:4-hydroxybenzoate polyprenyltransferase